MVKNTVSSGNEEIAEFMGETKKRNLSLAVTHANALYVRDYHNSWDKLMPVIIKIQRIQKEAMENNLSLPLQMVLSIEYSFEMEINIDKTYKRVLIFVNWYNRNYNKT